MSKRIKTVLVALGAVLAMGALAPAQAAERHAGPAVIQPHHHAVHHVVHPHRFHHRHYMHHHHG
ncbi:MAG: hypothetical protein HGA47_08210 [Zoogloea sp.]|nr:hypothetical protein [Zoogloea sp.]